MVPTVISREIIKPSSPTPQHQHLQKMKLSYLDQLMGPAYVSLIFFYQADDHHQADDHIRKSQRLKQSLSHALTSFYPLAGRLQDNFTIDCNDAGVEFIDARAAGGDNHTPLKDVIQEQHNDYKDGDDDRDHYLNRYLPVDPTTTAGGIETTEMPFFLVQVTYFDHCGGIAVGVRFMHRVADCASIMDFISAWARVNDHHGEITDDIQTPARLINYDLANYFPDRELPISRFLMPSGDEIKPRTNMFVFDKVKLSALRRLAGDVVERPTRVELVTAFIWKCIIDAHSDNNNNEQKIFAAAHGVNLRPRKKILENVFGNCFMMAMALEDGGEFHEFHELVRKWRSAIGLVNEDYITESSSEGGGGDNNYLNVRYKIVGLVTTKGRHAKRCAFSSWCGFPMYEVDFGWGKPIWLCPVGVTKDFTILINTRCGEGIEAWVCMDPDIVSGLEAKIQGLSSNDMILNS